MISIRVLGIGVLAALATCVTTASASAASNANDCAGAGALVVHPAKGGKAKAKANIQLENGACGANLEELPVIGTVSFTRTGNTVKLKVKVTKGTPNTAYKVQLAGNEPFCSEIGEIPGFTTNAKGKGKTSGSLTVPAYDTEFFADVDPNGFHNLPEGDTPYVPLP